ncbi:vacuolar protein sorting-associated protein 29 [[Candida] anglica]|uniref:Vacuolar protein sorting-associated protein 29 n=1 Tax=[Candida] anglica TaxID=148631 RepID=A0ABP0EJ18_9ASCO
MLTLAIGDIYIPDRALNLPPKFCKLLCPNPGTYPSNNKISKVICLGNITQSHETLEFLYNLSPSLNLVRGEMDDPQLLAQQLSSLSSVETQVPLYQTTTHDNLKIGFTNGHQVVPKNDPLSLLTLARELDVDILIWGGTHKVEAYTLDGKFFINPGSATGALSFDWPEQYEDEDEDEEEDEEEEEEEETERDDEQNGKSTTEELSNSENNIESGSKDNIKDGNDGAELKEDTKIDADAEIPAILEDPIPSFCLLDTKDSTCTLYIYTYLNGEVKVDKVSYTKE